MNRKNRIFVALVVLLVVLSAVYMVNPGGTSSQDPRARILGFMPYRIPSGSMSPTLVRGDFILAYTFAYHSAAPERGDIIVFTYPPKPDLVFVKRVIGLPGDSLELREQNLTLNGALQHEPYLKPKRAKRKTRKPYSAVVPPGQLLVLGDNRDNSADSRAWGFVPISNVIGEVTRIWMSNDDARVGPINQNTNQNISQSGDRAVAPKPPSSAVTTP